MEIWSYDLFLLLFCKKKKKTCEIFQHLDEHAGKKK